MEPLYDIYFTGQLIADIDATQAQKNLAVLFKTTPEKVAHIFSGKPHALKRGIDKAGALKYKAALHKAGMMVAFKAHQASNEKTPAAAETKPETSSTQAEAAPVQTAATQASNTLNLAPTGSDILSASEKKAFIEADIDTSAIKMVSAFMTIESEEKQQPPAPNTSHITVASVGEDLLIDKPEPPPPLPLDIDDIELAPAGSPLDELHDDRPPLNPDTSALSIAPTGADILEGVTKKPAPPPPNTDHLSAD
jgi:pyruvate/2-oxoglutarate dehydrogenase complex dihydrolipoamide acyltransferase (E2) component